MATGAGGKTVGSIELTESDGLIVARHTQSGVASQGETQVEALANLTEALQLHFAEEPEETPPEPEPSDAPWL